MKFEEKIFTYNEIDEEEKNNVHSHLKNCESCSALFREVADMNNLLKEVARDEIVPPHAARLTGNIITNIQRHSQTTWADVLVKLPYHSFSRMALSAVSLVLIITFGIEFFQEPLEQPSLEKVNSGFAILNSEDFKKEIDRRKKEAGLFAECTVPFKSQEYFIDCIKSKYK